MPASAREASRSALSSIARSTSLSSSSGLSSAPVRKCRVKSESSAGTSTTGGTSRPTRPSGPGVRGCCGSPSETPRTRRSTVSLLDEFARVLDGFEWDIALLQEAPPRWFAELGRRTRSNGVRVLTSRNLCPSAAAAPGRPQPRPDRLERRRLEPDPRAQPGGGSSSTAGSRSPGAPSSGACTGRASRSRTDRDCASPTSTPRPGCPSRRASRWCGRRRRRSSGRAAIRWCSEATSTCAPSAPRRPSRPSRERFGLVEPTAPDAIDHLLVRGLRVVEPPRRLAPERRELREPGGLRVRLADHAPVVATLASVGP